MKILILGAQGMLGHDLLAVFKELNPIGWDIKDCDITDFNQVKERIGGLNPEVVINVAAYTDVDGAETNSEIAFKVNAEAVKNLAQICAKLKSIFVHFSTDYVFDGDKPRTFGNTAQSAKPNEICVSKVRGKKEGYQEDDQPKNPLNVYGQSKLAGEQEILNWKLKIENWKFYLIRTSWLYGPASNPGKHKNFVETILKIAKPCTRASTVQGKEKEEIKVVNDQHGKPTCTYDLARAVKKLIFEKWPSGIYHLVNEEPTTWYDFAKEIIKLAGLKTKVLPCQTKDYPRPAKRPRYSILLNTKFPALRDWKSALKDYLAGRKY